MNTDNNNTQQSTQSIADYLAQLLKDRKQLAAFPNVFNHVERLLDEGKSHTLSLMSPSVVHFWVTEFSWRKMAPDSQIDKKIQINS